MNRKVESQNLLLPETFDLTPAQAIAFDLVEEELENCGFGLMRLVGQNYCDKKRSDRFAAVGNQKSFCGNSGHGRKRKTRKCAGNDS